MVLAALDGNGEKPQLPESRTCSRGSISHSTTKKCGGRWGQSEAFVESVKRTGHYTPDDWKAFRAEQTAMYFEACSALQAGKTPSDAAVMDIAERHRMSIDRWFYPCSHAMHRGLASMYESDDRFRQSIDKHGEGLTSFLAEAIRANAARHQD